MALEQNANILRKSSFITRELWNRCKGLATMQGKSIGEWCAVAMQEKYDREIKRQSGAKK